MSFLHGVETIQVDQGATPIQLVRTGVIGLVGIAPKGPLNELTVISTERGSVETFGEQLPGFNIPQSLKAIFDNGASRVIVVNTFDPATHVTAVVDEALTITNGKAKLANAPVNVPTITGSGGTPSYTPGVDYEIDAFGNLQVLDFTAISEGASLEADYNHLDAAAITDAVIIGSDVSGSRTGFKLLKESLSAFGYLPKILISPGYNENEPIQVEMIVQADELRAIALFDAPIGTTAAVAITGRGPTGTLGSGWQTSNTRILPCYPYMEAYDKATDANQNRPYSAFLAGIISANDQANGYWVSPSNKEIKGITGVERVLTSAINDPGTETNQLNEVGITTYFQAFGTGIRTWGNRNAGFPSSSSPDVFIPVQRVKDILHETLEYAMLPFLDRPINNALIDSIRESVNAFMRTLVGRGAIIDGECTFDPAENPPTEIAQGKLVFGITFMPPTPAERITFKSFLDISILEAVTGS